MIELHMYNYHQVEIQTAYQQVVPPILEEDLNNFQWVFDA